ncbi:MAG: ribonuclease PH [Candidatus Babeliales bacterium]
MQLMRSYGRSNDQVRPLKINVNAFGNGDSSVLLELGNTKVLCTVSLANSVPHFLKNKKQWWLTASYALLPNATQTRTERDACRRSDRSVEISRLIGRCLRSVVTLEHKQSEKTIYVDCDVLQADGGTRTACITAASIALFLAQERWLERKDISAPIIREPIAGVSLGIMHDSILVDIDYAEDAYVDADFNFVLSRSNKIIEIQGCAERGIVDWVHMTQMQHAAQDAIRALFSAIEQSIPLENAPTLYQTKDMLEFCH